MGWTRILHSPSPKEGRSVLNVHAGSVVIFEKENDKIIIKPAKTLRDYKGVLKTHGKVADFDDMREKAKIKRTLKMWA